jgi:hypothetical protein
LIAVQNIADLRISLAVREKLDAVRTASRYCLQSVWVALRNIPSAQKFSVGVIAEKIIGNDV